MFQYSDKVKQTVALFFRYKNDVDIYIEDVDDNEFYLSLLNRITEPLNIKISRLIPIGNRTKVIEACKNDQTEKKQKRLYIIDGDLDLINDINKVDLKYLYSLNVYCVENLIIDKDAIIEIMHDNHVVSKKTIHNKLNFDSWFNEIKNPLIELFLHFALIHYYKIGIPTVSLKIGRFCTVTKKHPELDFAKINDYIEIMQHKLIEKITETKYKEEILKKRKKWSYTTENLLKIVSGKDFLLPLIEFHSYKLKTKKSSMFTRDSFRMRLAKLCSYNNLKDLSSAIKKCNMN